MNCHIDHRVVGAASLAQGAAWCAATLGALPGQGRLPALIQWQGRHPTEAMPSSPVALQAVRFGAVQPREATLLRFRGAQVLPGGPAIAVTLDTPRGPIDLSTA